MFDELNLIKLLLVCTLAYEDNLKVVMSGEKLDAMNYSTVQMLRNTLAVSKLHDKIKNVNDIQSIQELLDIVNNKKDENL